MRTGPFARSRNTPAAFFSASAAPGRISALSKSNRMSDGNSMRTSWEVTVTREPTIPRSMPLTSFARPTMSSVLLSISTTLPSIPSTLASGSCASAPAAQTPRKARTAANAAKKRAIGPASIGDWDVLERRRKRGMEADLFHVFGRGRELCVPDVAGAFAYLGGVVGTGERNLSAVAPHEKYFLFGPPVQFLLWAAYGET